MHARRASLEPDLDLISVGIGDVSIWETRREFAAPKQGATGFETLSHRSIDVFWMNKTKPEMRDSSAFASGTWVESNAITSCAPEPLTWALESSR